MLKNHIYGWWTTTKLNHSPPLVAPFSAITHHRSDEQHEKPYNLSEITIESTVNDVWYSVDDLLINGWYCWLVVVRVRRMVNHRWLWWILAWYAVHSGLSTTMGWWRIYVNYHAFISEAYWVDTSLVAWLWLSIDWEIMGGFHGIDLPLVA